MVIIHAAGNSTIGIGNLVRSYSLALELKRVFEEELIIIFECNKKILQFLNKEKIDIVNFNSRKESIKFLNNLKLEKQINLYITDLLDIDKDFEMLIRSIGFKILVHLNDSCLEEYKPDVIIDGDGFDKKWDLNGVELIQSPKFHIIKNEIVQRRPNCSWNKEKVENILVCFGGSDPAFYTEELLLQLSKCDIIDKKFNFILGPGFSEERVNNLICKSIKNVEFFVNVDNIYDFILESDIVVSMGGGIAYESMCMGRASAAVGWKYLSYYVDNLDSNNMLKKISPNEMLKELMYFANNVELIKEIAFNGWNEIDGEASQRIADYIKKCVRK